MQYRSFLLLSTGGMLLGSGLISLLLVWMDPAANVTLGIIGGVSVTVLVLALDLLLWRLAPEALEQAGFRLGDPSRRSRHENAPVEEYRGAVELQKVYKYDLGLRILCYAVGGLIIVAGTGLGALYLAGVDTTGSNPDIGPVGNGLFVLFFVSMGLMLIFAGRSTKLILTAEGVEYRTLDYSTSTRWDNVQAIGPARYGKSTSESLLLRERASQRHGLLGQLMRISFSGKAIPLMGFGSSRYGPLSRDLQHYAPHLFDEDGRPRV